MGGGRGWRSNVTFALPLFILGVAELRRLIEDEEVGKIKKNQHFDEDLTRSIFLKDDYIVDRFECKTMVKHYVVIVHDDTDKHRACILCNISGYMPLGMCPTY